MKVGCERYPVASEIAEIKGTINDRYQRDGSWTPQGIIPFAPVEQNIRHWLSKWSKVGLEVGSSTLEGPRHFRPTRGCSRFSYAH